MKVLKRILLVVVFAFIMTISAFSFTACNLITTDKTAYYDQIVATFNFNDIKISVTMTDLNDAFKNYGYSRYNQGYYSTLEECIQDSLKYHVQKELLFFEIANTLNDIYDETNDELYNVSFVDLEGYSWEKTLDNIYESTVANALEIRYNAFELMQGNVDSFAEQILEEDDEYGNIEEPDEEESIRDEKTEYESKLDISEDDNGNITIKKKVEEIFLFNKTDIAKHYSLAYNYDTQVTNKAYNRYVKALQQTAKSENRSTNAQDVMAVEESYNIKNAYQSKILSLYEYWYETNNEISTEEIVDYYKNQFKSQLDKFEYNIDAYREAMESYNSEYVYYHNNSGNEYIIVNHILINFTEEQKQLIKDLDKELESNKKLYANDDKMIEELQRQYDKDLISIITDTKSTYIDQKGDEQTDYIGNIINEISSYVENNNLSNKTVMTEKEIAIQKSKNFEDMMYKYNDDPGNMNADFYYAVNVNNDVETNWEAEFTKGARELYNNDEYEIGSVLARPVVTSYGVHIMFYSQMAENIISADSIDALTAKTLVDAKVNPSSTKSIFEYLYDKIATDNYYDNFVTGVINQLYNTCELKIDSYKFENLWK